MIDSGLAPRRPLRDLAVVRHMDRSRRAVELEKYRARAVLVRVTGRDMADCSPSARVAGIAERKALVRTTFEKAQWIFESLLFPYVGAEPIRQLRAIDVLGALRKKLRSAANTKLLTAQSSAAGRYSGTRSSPDDVSMTPQRLCAVP
jgi:hypothetical protein